MVINKIPFGAHVPVKLDNGFFFETCDIPFMQYYLVAIDLAEQQFLKDYANDYNQNPEDALTQLLCATIAHAALDPTKRETK